MSQPRTAESTHATQAVEALIRAYEHYIADGFDPSEDSAFHEYLIEEVVPTMSAEERARYEGYLRHYYQARLGQPAERAPKLIRRTAQGSEIAATTEMAYERRANHLIGAYERTTGKRFDPDDEQFAAYMVHRLEQVGRASRRAYQAAMDYHYRVILGRSEGAPDFRKGIASAVTDNAPKKRQPQKGIRAEHLEKLVAYLARRNTFHARLAARTIEASVLFGLRPREWIWADVRVIKDPEAGHAVYALIVNNAKNSHGRAHSPTRTLLLEEEEATPDRLGLLDQTAEAWTHYVERFAHDQDEQPNQADRERAVHAILTATRQSIRRATKALNLPDYTLYSARHQFAANAKAAGLSRVEVAALMGHASPETAGEHYGKRRRGSGRGLIVRPSPDDLAAVEARVNATVEQRLARIRPRPERENDLGL